MINLNHLRYFYVFAQKKSVTDAAKTLGISQPSLSQQLKVFESEIGEALFVRNGRAIKLSSMGQVLYERSKSIFEMAESLTETFHERSKLQRSLFRIGVSDEIERPFIAEIVGKTLASKRGQRTKFEVISRKHAEIADGFNSSDFDLAILNSPLGRKVPVRAFNFPVYLVTSQPQVEIKHVNEANLNIVLQQLNQRLVVPSKGLGLRTEIDLHLKKTALVPEIGFESNILACIVRAIREGVGCGFVPLPYIREDQRRGALSVIGPKAGYWRHPVSFYALPRAETQVLESLIRVTSDYEV